ncbi:DUF6671 family protein [Microbulbifer sp. Q7]|uniref:DUF6671 family protein n=1 Tax=Microbulbifer sp. Q7 TaxID=1785091 RepID=UPI00082D9AD8|nr:DUF6671 family protein [Microbulbifer sp. Q7]
MTLSRHTNRYQNLSVALLTKHDKGAVISPPLAKLGLHVVTTDAFDTDTLGTFSGEIPRELSPRECAAHKARLACELTGLDFGLGSEGSFGGGPMPGLVNWDEELLVFYDAKQDLEITAHAAGTVGLGPISSSSWQELSDWVGRFPPEQAWILRLSDRLYKGLTGNASMQKILIEQGLLTQGAIQGEVRLEPDLRAMHCPERRVYIAQAAAQLCQRLQSLCPTCTAPDFWQTSVERGLPCAWCSEPTALAKTRIKQCRQCGFTERQPVEQAQADPGQCQRCNP